MTIYLEDICHVKWCHQVSVVPHILPTKQGRHYTVLLGQLASCVSPDITGSLGGIGADSNSKQLINLPVFMIPREISS